MTLRNYLNFVKIRVLMTVNLHVLLRAPLLLLRVTSMNWNTAQKTSLEIIGYEICTFLTCYSYTKALSLG